MKVFTDYNGIGKIQYIAAQLGLTVLATDYTEQVVMTVMVPEEQTDSFTAQVTEKTSGKARLETEGLVQYGILDDKVILL